MIQKLSFQKEENSARLLTHLTKSLSMMNASSRQPNIFRKPQNCLNPTWSPLMHLQSSQRMGAQTAELCGWRYTPYRKIGGNRKNQGLRSGVLAGNKEKHGRRCRHNQAGFCNTPTVFGRSRPSILCTTEYNIGGA